MDFILQSQNPTIRESAHGMTPVRIYHCEKCLLGTGCCETRGQQYGAKLTREIAFISSSTYPSVHDPVVSKADLKTLVFGRTYSG
jgi:hypothetical protein